VSVPSADSQIRFLVDIQSLLDDGQFVASYKFALLLSLCDLSVENGDDSGRALVVPISSIAEKFIQYYWRQAIPYSSPVEARVLRQNTRNQATVLNSVEAARAGHTGSLPLLMRRAEWKRLRRKVARTVKGMPLWKLQTIGRERLDFLYENRETAGSIILKSGVAYCFRKFHALISDLIRGAWVRFVRRQNPDILGEAADLHEFLFGSERMNLTSVRLVLEEVQGGACFYCGSNLRAQTTEVDHFIAWGRYPLDLGHNFVLADRACNNKKRDRLPAVEHLAKWTRRNAEHADAIAMALEERGIVSRLSVSIKVAEWAYAEAEAARGLTWIRKDQMVPLAREWRAILAG
jgi:hypothetical protein